MAKLDHYERAIIRYLGNRGHSTINQIADGLGISWSTANNRVKRLYSKGYLATKKGGYFLRY